MRSVTRRRGRGRPSSARDFRVQQSGHTAPTLLLHYQALMMRRRTKSPITGLTDHGTDIADILSTLCETSLPCLENLLAMPLSVPVGVGRNATPRSTAVKGWTLLSPAED